MALETTVYADVLFLVNFSMDFITLWISSLLSSRQRSALRMSLAAAIGGLYGVFSVIIGFGTALTYVLAAVCSIIMCLTAFGTCGSLFSLIKQSALIWGCGALLGGVMTAFLSMGGNYYDSATVEKNPISLIAAASVLAVYITVRIICNSKDRKTVTVRARWQNREISFSALCDSGNLMRDPLTGDPALPVSAEIISKLCGKSITESLLKLDTEMLSKQALSLRIIPHKTCDTSNIVGGFVPDSVTVISEKKRKDVKCVLVPRKCPKDYFAGCAAALPTSLLP